MIIAGGVFISVPFSQSLTPSNKAKSLRSQHDISTLNNGEYRFDKFGRENLWAQNVLLLKTLSGKLYVYTLPANKIGIPLPERWWGVGSDIHNCRDFSPNISAGYITCHDDDLPDWGDQAWVWDLNGKSRTFWVADLMAPKIEVQNNIVYINN